MIADASKKYASIKHMNIVGGRSFNHTKRFQKNTARKNVDKSG